MHLAAMTLREWFSIGAMVVAMMFMEGAVLPGAPETDELESPCRSMRVIGHRGAAIEAPENTMTSLRRAVEYGVDGVEFDVYRSKDGVLVLFHDKQIYRTTDARTIFENQFGDEAGISDLTFEELSLLDSGSWMDPQFAGERIPTLKEALEYLRGKAVPVIEIKDGAIGKEVAELVESLGLADEVITISFQAQAIRDFRAVLPQSTTGFLTSEEIDADPVVRARAHIRAARENGASALICKHTLLSPEYLKEALGRGMSVWSYTVNDAADMMRYCEWGLSGLITDDPRVGVAVRNSGEPPLPKGPFVPDPGRKGRRVDLADGEVSVGDISRFLSDFTGLPVLLDASNQLATRKVTIAAPIKDMDDTVAQAILETNGVVVVRRTAEDGIEYLKLSDATTSTPAEPRARPIVVDGQQPRTAGAPVSQRRREGEGFVTARPPDDERVMRVAGLLLGEVPEAVVAQVELRKGQGVFVLKIEAPEVLARSPLAGVEPFDIIYKVADESVNSPTELLLALKRDREGGPPRVRALRKGVTRILRRR